MDDCMHDKSVIRDENIKDIFTNQSKITLMLSMQYCMDLPPDLRANVDYVFVFRENNIDNQKKLWKSFFGIFPTFELFQETFMTCTENYECLVIDNTRKSDKIEDCVYFYKATYHDL
jgi:CRISPR/Cas system-associated endonuclease/helicase Cas3